FEDPEAPTSKTKIKFAKIISDLTEKKHNTPLCADPLLTYAWKDQVNEIIQLQEEFQNDPMVSKEIREQIKSSLGLYKQIRYGKALSRPIKFLNTRTL
ncbi:11187_t:CDS:2, partial [Gigaspora rosea]